MKRLIYFCLLMVLLSLGSCRRSQSARQYDRFQYDSAHVEFITPPADTVSLDDDGDDGIGTSPGGSEFGDDDGLVAIPDIPQERRVNMNSNSYEAEKMMKGGAADY